MVGHLQNSKLIFLADELLEVLEGRMHNIIIYVGDSEVGIDAEVPRLKLFFNQLSKEFRILVTFVSSPPLNSCVRH